MFRMLIAYSKNMPTATEHFQHAIMAERYDQCT